MHDSPLHNNQDNNPLATQAPMQHRKQHLAPTDVIQIYTATGNRLPDIYIREAIAVHVIKKTLSASLHVPRFRLRILKNTSILHDAAELSGCTSLQVIVLDYPPQTHEINAQLITFILEEQEARIEQLLQTPLHVNYNLPRSIQGVRTPLQAASTTNDPVIIRLLFEALADLNAIGNDLALWHAAATRSQLTVHELLQHRAQADTTHPTTGSTALLEAIINGDQEIVTMLLQAQAQAFDNNDSRPFRYACYLGHRDIACSLLRANCKIHRPRHPRDEAAITALTAAASENHLTHLKTLLELRVNVNARQPMTALWHAAWHGRTEALRLLLQNKVKADIEMQHGKTALSAAAFQGHNDAVQIILKHKSKHYYGAAEMQPLVRMAIFGDHPDTAQLLSNAIPNNTLSFSKITPSPTINRLKPYESREDLPSLPCCPSKDKLHIYDLLHSMNHTQMSKTPARHCNPREPSPENEISESDS